MSGPDRRSLGTKIRFPIWFDPIANGGTPMVQALGLAKATAERFISQHPSSFPPVVIHITDGESTDGDPGAAFKELTNLASGDGNVLLFNVHISSNPNAQTTAFPDVSAMLPDEYAKTLFEGASFLTPFMRAIASEHGLAVSEGAKGFVMNAELVLVIQVMPLSILRGLGKP